MKKNAERVEWATTYGLDLYNKGIEINEDVKKQFHTDYIDQFGYDDE